MLQVTGTQQLAVEPDPNEPEYNPSQRTPGEEKGGILATKFMGMARGKKEKCYPDFNGGRGRHRSFGQGGLDMGIMLLWQLKTSDT